MKQVSTFRKWVVGAGLFNIVAAFPLAMPFLFKPYYALLNALNTALGLGGGALTPPLESMNMLMVNTAGLALVLVGMMLIYASLDLENRRGIPSLNAVVRLVFAVLVVYYIVTEDISRVLVLFAGIDVVIAMVFLYYGPRLRSKHSNRR